MLRQSLIYLLISILVVVFAKFAHLLVVYIDMLYVYVNLKLSPFFGFFGFGGLLRKILLLVVIPVTIAGIPALSYRLVKGKEMPHFLETTWCIWFVVVLSNILIRY